MRMWVYDNRRLKALEAGLVIISMGWTNLPKAPYSEGLSEFHDAKICCVTSLSFSLLQRSKHSHLSTTGLLLEGPRASRSEIFELTPKKPFASDSY